MEEETPSKNGGLTETDALSIPLSTIELSVRTRNVLQNAAIVFLGDLISWTESGLMGLQNCGKKSVEELKELLAIYGLCLGVPIGWTAPEPEALAPPKRLNDYDEQMRAKFFLKVSDLQLSARADNVLIAAGIVFVGELIQKTAAQIFRLKSCGRTTIVEIEKRLETLGLSLGTEISDWDRKIAQTEYDLQAAALAIVLAEARRTALPDVEATCLEEELNGILAAVANERNAEIVSKLLGWSGYGRRTLESVGQEYGLTRERVRQIAAKAMKRARRHKIDTPWLIRAVNAVRQAGPATSKELAKLLRKARISKADFCPSGLAAACEEFGITFGIETRHLGGNLIYGKESSLTKLRSLYILCNKHTRARGCANFETMCDELEIPKSQQDGARILISKTGTNVWLDDNHCWLFAKNSSVNRLTNIISKVLFVSPRIRIGELRRAAAKSRRLQALPPTKVLAKFLETSGLGVVSGDEVASQRSFDNAIEPGSVEETILRVFKTHGPLLRWDKLQELCVAEGMNPITVGIYMSISPIIARVARGVYALVGSKIEPGVAEEISAEIVKSRRTADFGWTSRSTLWCAIEINRNILTSGSLNLPSFVTNMVDGKEWRIRFDGRFFGTVLKARNNFVWSLAKPLERLGAEPGDICILDFDLGALTVDLAVGGEDMVDAWESGDIDLIENNLPETNELEELEDDRNNEESAGGDPIMSDTVAGAPSAPSV